MGVATTETKEHITQGNDPLPDDVKELVDGPPEQMRKHDDGTKEMLLSMGPQHPSTHGVLRLQVRLDGEKVIDVQPDIGYLHRSWEKIVETWEYPKIVPFTDRNDYLGSAINEHVFCIAVERLLQLEVPERAEYIRVTMDELQRICSHLIWFGTFALDLGATTPFLWAFQNRERIYNLFEIVTGGRLFPQYYRIGGVRNDFPPNFYLELEKTLKDIEQSIEEFHVILTGNPIFKARTQGVGVLKPDVARAYACSGPMLRGSGVPWDIRKVDPYSIYDRFEFTVPTRTEGDVWSRYQVRLEEIQESIKIVRNAVDSLPAGPVLGDTPRRIRPPAGDIYVHVESPRGELGCYVVSDGGDKPFRVKWRSPCFANLQSIVAIGPDCMLADLVAIVGSIDIVLGEVDR